MFTITPLDIPNFQVYHKNWDNLTHLLSRYSLQTPCSLFSHHSLVSGQTEKYTIISHNKGI